MRDKTKFIINQFGYTLTELMMVTVLLGVTASFAIPSFTKGIDRSYRRNAENQLRVIHSANYIYRAQSGGFWPTTGTAQNAAAINAALRTNIIEYQMVFECTGVAAATSFSCIAYYPQKAGAQWTVSINQNVLGAANPTCAAGTQACP